GMLTRPKAMAPVHMLAMESDLSGEWTVDLPLPIRGGEATRANPMPEPPTVKTAKGANHGKRSVSGAYQEAFDRHARQRGSPFRSARSPSRQVLVSLSGITDA